jgi:ferredoxin-NADP reductase
VKIELISKNSEVPGVYSFIFKPDKPIGWVPGQYMHYVLPHPDPDDRGIERWFTISAAPFEENLRITTRFAEEKGSSFKKALLALAIGSELEADGVEGDFTLATGDVHHILIAGGIGITPYRSMLAQLAHDKKYIHSELLYANQDENLVFGDELAKIETSLRSFHVHPFIGRRLAPGDFKKYVGEPNSIFYLSGPEPLVENYEGVLAEMGVAKKRIKTDFFPGY